MSSDHLVALGVSYSYDAYTPDELFTLRYKLDVLNRELGTEATEGLYRCGVKLCVGAAVRLSDNPDAPGRFKFSEDERREILIRLAHSAETVRESYPALRALRAVGDRRLLLEFAERSLASYSAYDAYCAFCECKHRDGIYRSMLKAEQFKTAGQYADEIAFDEYIGERTYQVFKKKCQSWVKRNGANTRFGFNLGSCAIMANSLHQRFDVGIAIADSGMFSGFVFKTFGLPIEVVHSYRCGQGATFRWQNEKDSKRLKGKKVLLLDKDVASGRTMRRAVRELKKLGAASTSLALNHSPDATPTSIQNVPSEITEVFYPTQYGVAALKQAIQKLEKKLKV